MVGIERNDPSSPTGVDASWEETKQLLKDMQEDNDDEISELADNFFNLSASLENEQQVLLNKSARLKSDLDKRIQQEREARDQESNDLDLLQKEIDELQAKKDSLAESLKEQDRLMIQTKANIEKYKAEAAQEVQATDLIEAERLRQVPRLKQQISLYANCTRIKWDYDQVPLLAGQVELPNKQGFRRFSIDPREHTEVDVANYLWSLMDGKNPPLPPFATRVPPSLVEDGDETKDGACKFVLH